MDKQKDISNKIKKTENNLVFDNPTSAFVFKKTERLTCALYMLTNLIPEHDPLRTHLKDKSLCLLSDTVTLRTLNLEQVGNSSIGHSLVGSFISRINEIVALLEVARSSNLISEMNVSIMKRECSALLMFLQERGKELTEDTIEFSHDYFEIPPFQDKKQNNIKTPQFFLSEEQKTLKRQNKNMSDRSSHDKMTYRMSNQNLLDRSKGHESAETTLRDNKIISRSETGKTLARKNERKSTILKLVREKGRVGIKDISEVINNCSEKTLQRELLSLVKKGVLKKEGERRWSTYSFVT